MEWIRRHVGFVVAGMLFIGVLVSVALVSPRTPLTNEAGGLDATSSTSPSGPPPSTTGPVPAETAPPAAAPTTELPLTEGAASGPGIDAVGIHVLARPDATGDVQVVERILTAAPVSRLVISPPFAAGVPGLEGISSRLVGLQVESAGRAVAAAVPSPVTSDTQLDLPAPSTVISLTYLVTGVAARREPAPERRVLIALSPAAAKSLTSIPVVVDLVGPGVRNLVCPQLSGSAQLCGRERGGTWSTTSMPADRSLVIAQLDLPSATTG